MEVLPDLILEGKVELCQHLLHVLKVIEPGYSKIRGITFYEMHSPLLILALNQYSVDMNGKRQLRVKEDISRSHRLSGGI